MRPPGLGVGRAGLGEISARAALAPALAGTFRSPGAAARETRPEGVRAGSSPGDRHLAGSGGGRRRSGEARQETLDFVAGTGPQVQRASFPQ